MDFFIALIFGHLFGDFVCQTRWMAVNKSASSSKCFTHVMIYMCCIVAFTRVTNIYWLLFVFTTHFLIDRYTLGDKWLHLIQGRSLKDFMENGSKNIPFNQDRLDFTANYHTLRGGFTALCYAVVDNTFHLTLQYYSWILIRGLS